MQKQLIIACLGAVVFFAGCNEPATIPQPTSSTILCELNGHVGHYARQTGEETQFGNRYQVLTERVVVYCDGTYIWERPRKLEDQIGFPPTKGTVPVDIYLMLRRSAASSPFITINGVRSFTFDIGISTPVHPQGVDELFAYIYQKQ